MATRENFTAGRVAGYQYEPGKQQSFFWDAKTPGLGVRVTAAGAKSYIFETRLHGKTLRITIGDVRTWALGEAQSKATEFKAMTDQGIDPRQMAKDQQAKAEAQALERKRQNVTLGEVWDVYIEARCHKWSQDHLKDHRKMIQAAGHKLVRGKSCAVGAGPLASIAHLRLSEITPDKVVAWLNAEKAERPTQTALAYRLLRAFLNWCQRKPEYANLASPEACGKEASEELPKENAKDDALQREQLPLWFAEVRKIPNPVISAYLQTLLLTGARREELAGLQWQDVDFQWQGLTIRDKVEGERTIPLTPYVASLLASLPRRNQWVFSSPAAASGRLQDPLSPHRRAVANAGLPPLTLHGLRRSFGTLCEWVEMPVGISAQIMGHKPSATAEKHYRQRPLDLLRMWHIKIEGWILKQAGIQLDQKQAKPGLRVVAAT